MHFKVIENFPFSAYPPYIRKHVKNLNLSETSFSLTYSLWFLHKETYFISINVILYPSGGRPKIRFLHIPEKHLIDPYKKYFISHEKT